MLNWFVINTKPKKENQVERLMVEAGFEIYCPKYLTEKHRIKPFFPGYAFLKFSYPEQFKLVKYTRGIKKIVGNDLGPIPLPEETITHIKSKEHNGFILLERCYDQPEVGDKIEVTNGPLKGLKGIFKKELSDRERVMILLDYVSYQGILLIKKEKIRKLKK